MTEVPVAFTRTPDPVPGAGDIVHFTPWLEESLPTWAVMVSWPPALTAPAAADAETVMGAGGRDVLCPRRRNRQ